ncbi:MAG: ABC transporter permease [Clostridia bacterium]|nr:ABC transporter permease [Clostridia bacterium]
MKQKKICQRLIRWETMLVVLLIVLWVVFDLKDAASQSADIANRKRTIKDVFNLPNMISGIGPYMLYGFMALGMTLILGMGGIDISIGAIGAMSAAVMAVCYGVFKSAMNPSLALVLSAVCCLITGAACGLLNGALITRFRELFPMIITLGTQLLYRGLTYLLIGGKPIQYKDDTVWESLKMLYNGSIKVEYSEKVLKMAKGATEPTESYITSTMSIPNILLWFFAFALIFFVFLHLTKWGRQLFAIGTNREASRLSGVRVANFELIMYMICGITAAISGMFYIGSASGTMRADALKGYEMYAIAAVVLGGFSTNGGTGNIIGVILSMFVFAVMKKGMGTVFLLIENAMDLAVGVVLIVASLLPNILEDISIKRRLHRQHKEAALS